MGYFVNRKNVERKVGEGIVSYQMLNESNGCMYGFLSGITVYTETEYLKPGVHEDQEGFIVMEGYGWAKVGHEEYRLEPDVCFIAPAGVAHAIKRAPEAEHVKVCWFHGAVK
jgi:mannose-6-phosphate isomerase-like protein (cupin superfamily)